MCFPAFVSEREIERKSSRMRRAFAACSRGSYSAAEGVCKERNGLDESVRFVIKASLLEHSEVGCFGRKGSRESASVGIVWDVSVLITVVNFLSPYLIV